MAADKADSDSVIINNRIITGLNILRTEKQNALQGRTAR